MLAARGARYTRGATPAEGEGGGARAEAYLGGGLRRLERPDNMLGLGRALRECLLDSIDDGLQPLEIRPLEVGILAFPAAVVCARSAT